jgi:valyl-tRNA synthetase
MHPMAPFITEEIFQLLKKRLPNLHSVNRVDPYTAATIEALNSNSCIKSPYPTLIRKSDLNEEVNKTFAFIEEAVYTIRNIRGEMNLPPSVRTDIYVVGEEKALSTVQENQNIISALVKVDKLIISSDEPKLSFSSIGVVEDIKIIIPLPDEFREKEKVRLEKEREKLLKTLERARAQLQNQDFIARAPKSLVEKQRTILEQTESQLEQVKKKLISF